MWSVKTFGYEVSAKEMASCVPLIFWYVPRLVKILFASSVPCVSA